MRSRPIKNKIFPPGYFRNPGSIHLHIDYSQSLDLRKEIDEIIGHLEGRGFESKYNRVINESRGPQHENPLYRETYATHAQGEATDKLGEFTVTLFGVHTDVNSDLVDAVRYVIERLDGLPPELQRASLDTLRDANQQRLDLMRDPEIASRISNYELAYRMQSSAPELSDFSGESKSTLEAYGVDRAEPPNGGRGKSGETAKSFGRNCLLSRRLVERGVRFVNIVYASWDHHSEIDKELGYNATVVDQPVAALIKDLKDRGMLEDTMVVWGSEFGRTPLGQDKGKNPGRDHHPFSFSMLMAGGGIKGGQVYGQTDEFGWGVEDKPVHINDLHATMMHCFGMDHEGLTYRFQGRDFRLTDVGGNVIGDWLA